MTSHLRTAVSVALLVLALAACDGNGDDVNGGEEAGEIRARFVAVDVDYTETPGNVSAGEVTVELVNEGNLTHNVTLENAGDGAVVQVDGGVTGTGTVTLEPGEYVAYCSIAGHREAGMEATVTVDG